MLKSYLTPPPSVTAVAADEAFFESAFVAALNGPDKYLLTPVSQVNEDLGFPFML